MEKEKISIKPPAKKKGRTISEERTEGRKKTEVFREPAHRIVLLGDKKGLGRIKLNHQ